MTDFLQTPLFGIVLTIGAFALAQWLYQRTRMVFLNPVLVAIVAVILLLSAADIPYSSYAHGGDIILFLLGPSVVALAVPLYQRRQDIARRKNVILIGIFFGALASIVSACGIGWLLGGSPDVVLALSPKSVTTPIAISIIENLGGVVPLTAATVVLTGCLGGVCGPEFCRLIGVRSPVAVGLAVGTAAHGIGTARMMEIDRLSGAVAGLAIGLNGLFTTFLLPLLMLFFRG
ncbi:MAG: CidB/LrgB family autolysis modulator [Desulfuromonas sp.]|nr:MAG: CidB/LrgB family autolysis modulator [Desulfuromonas sp.]